MNLDFANWPVGPLPIIVALLSLKRLFDIVVRGKFRTVSHDVANFLAFFGFGASMTVVCLWIIDQIWPGTEQHITFSTMYTLAVCTSTGFSLLVHYVIQRFCGTSPFLGKSITREIVENFDLEKFKAAVFCLVLFVFGFGFIFSLGIPGEITNEHARYSIYTFLTGSDRHNYGFAWAMGGIGLISYVIVVFGLRAKRIMDITVTKRIR